MMLPGFVKAPVFGDAQRRIVVPLFGDVNMAGAWRCDFQHKVRRFALLRDDVAVAPVISFRVGIEGYQQVGVTGAGHIPGRPRDDVEFRADDGGIGVAQVDSQVMGVAGEAEMLGAGHFFVLPLFRRVRQPEPACGRRQPGNGAGIGSGHKNSRGGAQPVVYSQ